MNKREIVGYALYQIGKFGRKEPDFLSILCFPVIFGGNMRLQMELS